MRRGSDPAKVEREPVWLDRVTASDLMLIWPEEQGWAQYIGALVTLDGGSLRGANGGGLRRLPQKRRNGGRRAGPLQGECSGPCSCSVSPCGSCPRQRFMNAYVANVPGPPIPLYLAGAPLPEIFPIVPLTANISIGVGALSYAGQLNLAVVADRDLYPDLDTFVDGVRRSLGALERGVAPAAS